MTKPGNDYHQLIKQIAFEAEAQAHYDLDQGGMRSLTLPEWASIILQKVSEIAHYASSGDRLNMEMQMIDLTGLIIWAAANLRQSGRQKNDESH